MTMDSIKTYADLAEVVGDMVLCNKIAERDFLEIENGETVDEDGNYIDIYQYYIISGQGAEYLEQYTDEIVFYDNDLDIYVWGITHCGTWWKYVPFEFPNNDDEEEE